MTHSKSNVKQTRTSCDVDHGATDETSPLFLRAVIIFHGADASTRRVVVYPSLTSSVDCVELLSFNKRRAIQGKNYTTGADGIAYITTDWSPDSEFLAFSKQIYTAQRGKRILKQCHSSPCQSSLCLL